MQPPYATTTRSFGPAALLLACLLTTAACGGAAQSVRDDRPDPSRRASTADPQLPVVLAEPAVQAGLPDAAADAALDTVRAGRFDQGKMWTFEHPPVAYLAETYGFAPDDAWFERARLGALRIPGCSASFVSPHGLLLTNHHCAQGSVSKVSGPGEALLDNGFYAPTLEAERPVEGYYADQLIAIRDVTDVVDAAVQDAEGDADRARARRAATQALEARLRDEYAAAGDSIVVQVISLYHGGRYSAYVFRRYTDLRLVMAPEKQLGYFGGDWDNFTYPRYALDMAFFRAYDDGRPLRTEHYFPLAEEGVNEGDLIFVIGNPGSTSRLETVAQLGFRRAVQVPAMLDFLTSRVQAVEAYLAARPEEAEAAGARNMLFSLMNAQKAYLGRQDALEDPVLMARRADAERQFRAALAAEPELQTAYGGLIDRMAALQARRQALAADYSAFLQLTSPSYASATLRRALLGLLYQQQQAAGNAETAGRLREQLLATRDQARPLEQAFLAAQLQDLQQYFGAESALAEAVLQGRTPAEAARAILDASAYTGAEATARAVAAGTFDANDPAVRAAAAILPRYVAYEQAMQAIATEEQEVAGRLGRARFDVYGITVPPDATFSPRFTDGVVKGYPYNGTLAPWHTTFYGLYDHYHSYGPDSAWDLPQRWLSPPATFDRATPLNFTSTADTIGGNSGSPVVDRDLRLVGINFDRNIEGLSRDYLYSDRGRNIMVDVRAVVEALDDIYDADRLVLELRTGRSVPTEAEADAAGRP